MNFIDWCLSFWACFGCEQLIHSDEAFGCVEVPEKEQKKAWNLTEPILIKFTDFAAAAYLPSKYRTLDSREQLGFQVMIKSGFRLLWRYNGYNICIGPQKDRSTKVCARACVCVCLLNQTTQLQLELWQHVSSSLNCCPTGTTCSLNPPLIP